MNYLPCTNLYDEYRAALAHLTEIAKDLSAEGQIAFLRQLKVCQALKAQLFFWETHLPVFVQSGVGR